MSAKTDTKEKVSILEEMGISLVSPSQYNVIFHNDNTTPFELVNLILIHLFNKSRKEAEAISMSVHENGKAVVGTYMKSIAEQLTDEATQMSLSAGFALKVTYEPA